MEQLSAEDQQYINDLNLVWLESRYGKFSGSNIISLMTGIDNPELLGKTKVKLVHKAIETLDDTQKSKVDGSPLIKPLREALGWGTPITAEEAKYAYKQLDPYTEGLKTYAEKVAVESITKFTPDPELTKPWIIRGRELEVPAIERLSIILDVDFENVGHDQKFIDHPTITNYGSTPDALIKDGGVNKLTVEGKAPNSDTHLKYRMIKNGADLKEVQPTYFYQMQSQMDCCETDKGLFFSYDDRFHDESLRLHYCYIERDEKVIRQIHQRLEMANEWIEEFLTKHL